MAARRSKRGFIAPQTAAALSALDFAAAAQAFRRALAIANTGRADDDATDAASDVIAEMADRMLSIPVTAPADIAEKVVAYGWMNTLMSDLSDPAQQHRIAASSNDAAKGLLAIYLDLKAPAPDRSVWDAAVRQWEDATEALRVADATSHTDDDYDAEHGPFAVWCDAWEALMDAPAPDALANIYKLRTIIAEAYGEAPGDDADNLTFMQALLNDRAQDSGFTNVRLLQDAYRQAGIYHPVLGLVRQKAAMADAPPAMSDTAACEPRISELDALIRFVEEAHRRSEDDDADPDDVAAYAPLAKAKQTAVERLLAYSAKTTREAYRKLTALRAVEDFDSDTEQTVLALQRDLERLAS